MTTNINKHFRTWALLSVLLSAFCINANAQFNSGSTGADGALDYSNMPTGSTIVFDPGKFDVATHPLGQNVYNFTTINVPANITVVLSGQLLGAPVFWLATGDVHIDGTILMRGQNGPDATANTSLRVPASPGPGGFFGGVGGDQGSAAQPGAGLLGGAAGISTAGSPHGSGGGFNGNSLFAPPVGGSGGGGAFCSSPTVFGPGGGAGGGALIVASSTQIILNGTIVAVGGGGFSGCDNAGGGAGGAVKLAANSIGGSGTIVANGGNSSSGFAAAGAIQLEGFQIGGAIRTDIPSTQAAPGALFIPNQPVSIQVVSVAGTQLPTRPSGMFQTPDVVINTNSAVSIVIQTTGIPPGTVLTLNIYSEDGTTQTVQTTALQGTLQSATATATVTFPPDLSLGFLKATWTQ
jgi:hypothetical protein